MEIKEKVTDMYDLLGKGQLLEAFDKYYADNVVMQENDKAPMVGKTANREREKSLVDGLSPVDDFLKVHAITTGDNISIAEYTMHINHKVWGDSKKTQVAVQQWKDGKIVHEKFYYGV